MKRGLPDRPLETCRRRSCDRCRDGSILMETLLVLPLFLMLLGGMFVLGDLMMGRLLQLDVDRVVAWRAKDRFVPDSALHPDMSIPEAFAPDIGRDGVVEKPVFVASGDDGKPNSVGNYWIAHRAGRSEVTVAVPWWTAYMDVQNVMFGDGERFQPSFKLDSEDGEFLERFRSFVLRRRDSSQTGVRARMTDADALNWIATVFDSMAGTPVRAAEGRPVPPAPSGYPAYTRIPHAIVASGDPGP